MSAPILFFSRRTDGRAIAEEVPSALADLEPPGPGDLFTGAGA